MPSDAHWQKSSFSGGGGDEDCLEISATPTNLHLRESDTPAAVLAPTPTALNALLTAVKYAPPGSPDSHWQKSSYSAGDADNDCLEISATPTTLHFRESDIPAAILSPTPAALNALLTAVKYAPPRSPETHWQKSSFSGGGDDEDCLEISASPATLHLRESDTPAAVLSPTPAALNALLTAVKRR